MEEMAADYASKISAGFGVRDVALLFNHGVVGG
jgi:hypothetical protein